MIYVLVGNKHPADIAQSQAALLESCANAARTDTSIHQNMSSADRDNGSIAANTERRIDGSDSRGTHKGFVQMSRDGESTGQLTALSC